MKKVKSSHTIDSRIYEDSCFLASIDLRAELTDEEFEKLAKRFENKRCETCLFSRTMEVSDPTGRFKPGDMICNRPPIQGEGDGFKVTPKDYCSKHL